MSSLTRAYGLIRKWAAPLAGAVFLAALALSALAHPAEGVPDLSLRLSPPGAVGHPLGTDALGRGLAGRVLEAARSTLGLALVAVSASMAIGTALGLAAGFWRRWVETVVTSLTDLALAFPSLLLALVVVYALGPEPVNILVAIVATRWPVYARVVRAEVLRLRKLDYVRAARSVGGSSSWIARKHLLPALGGTLASLAAVEMSAVALAESSLSFLGLGVQPPGASLGLMVAQGSGYLNTAPWLAAVPGAMLFTIVLACTGVARGLAVWLNPSRRHSWKR